MSTIPNEIIEKLSGFQNQIWQTVSLTASETANFGLNFGSPETSSIAVSDLYGQVSEAALVIQFSFTSLPENAQIVLIDEETFSKLAGEIRGSKVTEIDDDLISEIRPVLESLVQGICLAIGNLRNDAYVASGMSIRFQMFSFPPSMQEAGELILTDLTLASDNFSGKARWLIDNTTAHTILGIDLESEGENESDVESTDDGSLLASDDSSLDILMDIPLQVSVELGRVKMILKDVIELGAGSIIEIEKSAGEPVDVLVNKRLVARGEVVVIEDNFGVRITEILSPHDRLSAINEAA